MKHSYWENYFSHENLEHPIRERGFIVAKFPDNSIYLGYAHFLNINYGEVIVLFESCSLHKKYGNIMTSFIMYDKILREMDDEFQLNLNNFSTKNLEFVEICICTSEGQIFHYNGFGYKYDEIIQPFLGQMGFIYKIDNELDFIPDWLMYYFEKSNIHLDKDKVVYEI